MSVSEVLIEGNVIDNGTVSTGSYGYDMLCLLKTPSIVTNNVFNAGAATMLSVQAKSSIQNNRFSAAATTAMLAVSANSQIQGNEFSGIGTGASFITLTSCKCTVQNNRFERSATSVTSYISISGTSGHVITDNYFDSSTTDGSTETLIASPTSSDVRERNANESYFKLLPISAQYNEGTNFRVTSGGAVQIVDTFVNTSGSTNNVYITHLWYLSNFVPFGSRITGVVVAYTGSGTFNTSGNTTFTTGMYHTLDLTSNMSTPSGAIATMLTDGGQYLHPTNQLNDQITISDTSGYSTLTNGSSKYLKMLPSSPSPYIVTPTQDVIVTWDLNCALTGSSSVAVISSILVKYTHS